MSSPRQTMDFFAHQDSARKRTAQLVILYSIAVIITCAAVGAATAFAGYVYTASNELPELTQRQMIFIAVIASIVTALLIVGAALYRMNQLSSGGVSVALRLGAQPLNPDTNDPEEKRLLNVVEEMAIASGVPVPPVFAIRNESSINAFAAGYSTSDAVIGVTEGCYRGLTREELQGVMAHEFSHILNQDMRLNIRMLGLLNGILFLTLVGHVLIRAGFVSGASSRRSDREGGMAALAALGLVLLILGSIGAFMARLIQAAVSRQREYLADAAAVQFTRHPPGIANALRRIGKAPRRGRIRSAFASEANHMLFAEGVSAALASHPPLRKRITRITPEWDGTWLAPIVSELAPDGFYLTPVERLNAEQQKRREARDQARKLSIAALPLLAVIGDPTPSHIDAARRLIQAIPDPLKDAAHDVYSARAVVYALLLDARPDIRERQYQLIKDRADPTVYKLLHTLEPHALSLKRQLRLPLLDITLGALAQLTERQHTDFRANVQTLIEADRKLDLFEWVTLRVLQKHLDERFHPPRRQPANYYALTRLAPQLSSLLSALAYAGTPNPAKPTEADIENARHAFDLGAHHLDMQSTLALIPPDQCSFVNLENALDELVRVVPKIKQRVLGAAALTVAADRTITSSEAELLRAVADMLAVPAPPLLPGQKLV